MSALQAQLDHSVTGSVSVLSATPAGSIAAGSHHPDAPAASRSIEGTVQVVIMLAIGAAAGAASFTHVHDVAASHGQVGWLAWADAVVLELMSIASGVELRRRERSHTSVFFPAAVMATAVVLSLSAQVVEAEQSAIGWIAAAIPALGFLVMVKIALSRADASPATGPAAVGIEKDSRALSSEGQSGCQAGGEQAAAIDPVVLALVPAARAAALALDSQGRRLSRQALLETMRADGYAVSNARACVLLQILKAERGDERLLHARRVGGTARGGIEQ
jgi:hypothetical protein